MIYVDPKDPTRHWDSKDSFEGALDRPVNITILSQDQWDEIKARYKALGIDL